MRVSAQCFRAGRRWLFRAVLPLLLTLLTLPALPVQAADVDPQRWDLRDGSGGSWGVVLFAQPDPGYPPGWRLRLNARTGAAVLDHQRPLQVDDGIGHHWRLENCSAELVPPGDAPVPSRSAQFDLETLMPRPSEALPLHLRVPLEDGEADLVLGPDQVSALSDLPLVASVS